jgi:peptide/nickel transport system substrate-binding protein
MSLFRRRGRRHAIIGSRSRFRTGSARGAVAVGAGLALPLAVATLGGCNRNASPDAGAATPQRGGTLRVAVMRPLDAPSWFVAPSGSTRGLLEHVVPPLGRYDENGTLHPYAAQTVLDAGYDIICPLRRLRWSDGARVLPRDFVLTTQLVRDQRTLLRDRPRTDLLAAAEAADDSTLVLEFKIRYAQRIADALWWPTPAHAWPQGADPARFDPRLACGPYRIASASAHRLVLVRHDESGFAPAFVDTVHVERRDPAAALHEFRAGAIDVIDDLPVTLVPRLRGQGARIVALVGQSYVFVGWNLRDGRWHDAGVRRALAQAVDVHALIERWTLGQGAPARGPLVPAHAFADTGTIVRYDRRAAEQALRAAGFIDHDGDGVRDQRGTRLAFHILAPATDSVRVGIAHDVARALRPIGVRAEVRVLPLAELTARLAAGAFEAYVGRWYPELGQHLDAVWRSDSPHLNFGGFADAGVDSLLTMLSHESQGGERRAAMAALQARVYGLQPYLFLFQMPQFVVFAPRVRGAEPSVVQPFWNLPEWWLAPSARRLAGRRRDAHLAGRRRRRRGGRVRRLSCCA